MTKNSGGTALLAIDMQLGMFVSPLIPPCTMAKPCLPKSQD